MIDDDHVIYRESRYLIFDLKFDCTMSSERLSNAPQRQTTVTKTTITTITTTTTTTETQTISPSPESNFPANNVPSSEPSHGHSPTTTRTSISSDASHPDDLRMPLHNERVDGFFVVLTG